MRLRKLLRQKVYILGTHNSVPVTLRLANVEKLEMVFETYLNCLQPKNTLKLPMLAGWCSCPSHRWDFQRCKSLPWPHSWAWLQQPNTFVFSGLPFCTQCGIEEQQELKFRKRKLVPSEKLSVFWFRVWKSIPLYREKRSKTEWFHIICIIYYEGMPMTGCFFASKPHFIL